MAALLLANVLGGRPSFCADWSRVGVGAATASGCRPGMTLKPLSDKPAGTASGRLRESSLSLSANQPTSGLRFMAG